MIGRLIQEQQVARRHQYFPEQHPAFLAAGQYFYSFEGIIVGKHQSAGDSPRLVFSAIPVRAHYLFEHGFPVVEVYLIRLPVISFFQDGMFFYGSADWRQLTGKQFQKSGFAFAVLSYDAYPFIFTDIDRDLFIK